MTDEQTVKSIDINDFHILNEGRMLTVRFGFIGSEFPLTVELSVFEDAKVVHCWSVMSTVVTGLNKGKSVVKIKYPNGDIERTTRRKEEGLWVLTHKKKTGRCYHPSYSTERTLITEEEWNWLVSIMRGELEYYKSQDPGNPCYQDDFEGPWFDLPSSTIKHSGIKANLLSEQETKIPQSIKISDRYVLNQGRMALASYTCIAAPTPMAIELKVYEGVHLIGYLYSLSDILTGLNEGKSIITVKYPNGDTEIITKNKKKGMWVLTQDRTGGREINRPLPLAEITDKEWKWLIQIMHKKWIYYKNIFSDVPSNFSAAIAESWKRYEWIESR